MKAASIALIKKELQHYSQEELIALCLRLAKFKTENKELLSFLLFQAHNEDAYIASVIRLLDTQFDSINTASFHYIKKSIRKILRSIKKFARYSGKKETEVELLLYFCIKLKMFEPSIFNNVALTNLYHRQLATIKKLIVTMHEDLQYDFNLEIEKLEF